MQEQGGGQYSEASGAYQLDNSRGVGLGVCVWGGGGRELGYNEAHIACVCSNVRPNISVYTFSLKTRSWREKRD